MVDKKSKIDAKVSKKALIAALLIGCLALPVIGHIGLMRFAGPRPASDEGRIVFVKYDPNAREKEGITFTQIPCIYVMDADGKNEKQLTDDGSLPAWSPDGKQIAFVRGEIEQEWVIYNIYVMNADGSNVKRLTKGPGDDRFPSWSPDGKQIAFEKSIMEKREDGRLEEKSCAIYVMNADGSNMKRLSDKLAPFFLGNPDWAPDGKEMAVVSRVPGESAMEIWVIDAHGNNWRKLVSGDGFNDPVWSPDGRRIAFEGFPVKPGGGSDIYVMDADGENVETLTDQGSATVDPAWSPDGTKIAFRSNQDGWWDIYVMDADGSNVRRLTNTPQDEMWLDWTAFSYAVESAGKLRATWGRIKAK